MLANVSDEKKNAPEIAAQGATAAEVAAVPTTTEYTTEPSACQDFPTLDAIAAELAAVARQRIETARRDLNDARVQAERKRAACDAALKAAQERAETLKAQLAGLADERTAMEQRAQALLGGEALKAMLEKIHLACSERQLALEREVAEAQADAADAEAEAQAESVTAALEIQLYEQELERLEAAAPEMAEAVRLAAERERNLKAALAAARLGNVAQAEESLALAKAGGAARDDVQQVNEAIAAAKAAKTAREFIARLESVALQIGGVRAVKAIGDKAKTAGVADKVAPFVERALEAARKAADARFAQARPVADHLVGEGLVPVVGDGRIEAWKQVSRNGSGQTWTLDRVMVLRDGAWKTITPCNPVTRRKLPRRVKRSRWFKPAAK